MPNQKTNYTDESTYRQWVKTESIPVIRKFFIQDIKKVKLAPWDRNGGRGVILT